MNKQVFGKLQFIWCLIQNISFLNVSFERQAVRVISYILSGLSEKKTNWVEIKFFNQEHLYPDNINFSIKWKYIKLEIKMSILTFMT